jgi:hypothetical protein
VTELDCFLIISYIITNATARNKDKEGKRVRENVSNIRKKDRDMEGDREKERKREQMKIENRGGQN